MVSNIALQNRINALAAQVRILQKTVCCTPTGLQTVSVGDSATISLSGSGTPEDPIVAEYVGSGAGVQSVQQGTGIIVDNTDPANPIISATAPTISNIYTTNGTIVNQNRVVTLEGSSGGQLVIQGSQMTNTFHNLQTEIKYGSNTFTVNSSGVNAPTVATATANTQIATTAFVHNAINAIALQAGNTAGRPASPSIGKMYFDTDLAPAKPIWWNGTAWVDATGTAV